MAKILALDDVSDAVHLIKRILETKGHDVSVFTEEEAALTHACHEKMDLAILDIKLKKMSGLEVLAELKKTTPTLRAIMLTGYPTLETAHESLKLGADDYCIKPVDGKDLEVKIDILLDHKEAKS